MSFLALFVWQAISLDLDVTATLDGGSTFWWISTPRCIFIHTKPTKGTSLVISASFEPLHIFIRRLVRAVRESEKHEIKKKSKKSRLTTLYFTHMARGNCTVDCNQSWHILRSRRRNQSYKFLCRSLRPFRSYTGSKLGVSHRKRERVLTLCLARHALARDQFTEL